MYAPWNNRKIGVELELNKRRTDLRALSGEVVRTAIIRGVQAAGGDAARLVAGGQITWRKSSGATWDMKTDASAGWEIASRVLLLDETGHNVELQKVMASVAALRPSIDHTCGHHLHVDVSDLSWQQVQQFCRLWVDLEPWMFSIVADSRRNNHYCAALSRTRWDTIPSVHHANWRGIKASLQATSNQDFVRHKASYPRAALNMAHWWQHGRIEIRLHQGTISYEEVRTWAMLVLALIGRVTLVRLPEIPYIEPVVRDRPYPFAYIWKLLALVRQREVPLVHDAATGLMTTIEQWIATRNPPRLDLRAQTSAQRLLQEMEAERRRQEDARMESLRREQERHTRERTEREQRAREEAERTRRERARRNFGSALGEIRGGPIGQHRRDAARSVNVTPPPGLTEELRQMYAEAAEEEIEVLQRDNDFANRFDRMSGVQASIDRALRANAREVRMPRPTRSDPSLPEF